MCLGAIKKKYMINAVDIESQNTMELKDSTDEIHINEKLRSSNGYACMCHWIKPSLVLDNGLSPVRY